MPPLLANAPMLRSRDIEETRAFLGRKSIRLDVLAPRTSATAIDAQLNGVYLPNVWLGYIDYRTRSEIVFSEGSSAWLGRPGTQARAQQGEFWIHVPLRGRFEARSAQGAIACDERRGIVISPSHTQALRTESDNARLGLSLRRQALESHLGALLGEMPREPLEFDPVLRVDEGHGGRLLSLLRWAASQFDRADLRESGTIVADFEQLLVNWLLMSQPSNYSDAIGARRPRIAPRDVRTATEYIHARLEGPITLTDLVRATGIAGRTLLKHFRAAHGVSPMRYARIRRLQRVRDELAAGQACTVASVASRWGFAHPGRFSIEYRKRFGEAPSATLARARRRA